jgi:hypothetical protein
MPSAIIVALIGLLGVIIGAIPTYFFMRQKNMAEIEKLKAETEKIKAEADKIRADIKLDIPNSVTLLKVPDSTVYAGLKLVEDVESAHTEQYAKFGAGLESTMRLWAIVSNENKDVYDSQVLLEDFEFSGNTSNNIWKNLSGSFERKAMKLDNADIPQNGKATLEIARATRKHPNINMQLSYLDGYSSSTYVLEGEYRVTLGLRGNVLVNNQKTPIENQRYLITFKYQNLPLLKITKIEKK